ncbi:MAG: PAS domain-containing protein [Planctomycetes bacterium]|nr:PAS domain-containing protein [Planctomycetota bacterium]
MNAAPPAAIALPLEPRSGTDPTEHDFQLDVERHLAAQLDQLRCRCDRQFAWLMACQWVIALAVALVVSPRAWEGATSSIHVHVWFAGLVGGVLTLPVAWLARWRPGAATTRHAVAIAQMLWSAILIHLTGGRIETHFHVFGSIAFLAFYRDRSVILTATLVVVADHLLRGLAFPQSVYGVPNPEWWRFLEHAGWVLFEIAVLVAGIAGAQRDMRSLAVGDAKLEATNDSIERTVLLRTRELAESREQLRGLLETTRAIPWELDAGTFQFGYVGPQAARLLDLPPEAWTAPTFWQERVVPEDRERTLAALRRVAATRADEEVEFRLRCADGRVAWVRSVVSASEQGSRLRGVLVDVTERRRLELELQQSQKLESVGRLAAGVAHEINTPVQFVCDSIHYVRGSCDDLFSLIARYREATDAARAERIDATTLRALAEAERVADVEYALEHVPRALDRSLEGLGRIATIVSSMKEFAHPDQREMVAIDLNRAIESTLAIARGEYKYVADVATDLGELPPVVCHAGEVNQVVLNLLVNAAHAIADAVRGSERRGRIAVRTRKDGDDVVVSIADDGAGIPLEVRPRLFEPFFTTKEVGRGTGQGLAIARAIVVERHGGSISFESAVGVGTTFTFRLPVHGASRAAVVASVPS